MLELLHKFKKELTSIVKAVEDLTQLGATYLPLEAFFTNHTIVINAILSITLKTIIMLKKNSVYSKSEVLHNLLIITKNITPRISNNEMNSSLTQTLTPS
ncbi:MAG: hypothetical protein GC192_09030 [Bacteroidetes bacterium]|nr:hypothetical protein [Bacteroidota bacterium]